MKNIVVIRLVCFWIGLRALGCCANFTPCSKVEPICEIMGYIGGWQSYVPSLSGFHHNGFHENRLRRYNHAERNIARFAINIQPKHLVKRNFCGKGLPVSSTSLTWIWSAVVLLSVNSLPTGLMTLSLSMPENGEPTSRSTNQGFGACPTTFATASGSQYQWPELLLLWEKMQLT